MKQLYATLVTAIVAPWVVAFAVTAIGCHYRIITSDAAGKHPLHPPQ